jgi:cytochrome c oxidase assembly factor CtaG
MKRIITIAIGLLGVLMGVGLMLPALAKLRDMGAMPGAAVVPYTLGIVLALLGIGTTAFSLMRRKAA